MRRTMAAVAVAVALSIGAGVGPATAQTAPNQHVKITFAGGYTGVAVATGVINAVGTAQEQSTLNPDGSFFGTLTFRFAFGTVVAPFTGQVTSLHVDPRTCTGRFTTAGTFTISHGTGLYSGIRGHGSFTEEGTFNSLPTAGGCSPEPLVRTLLVTEATATVTR
ncbi:MAG: hypothetical protein M3203_16890 [Actinomycetota bacterium]|nr:hypothetical protein [Actinomycetota bacterium]